MKHIIIFAIVVVSYSQSNSSKNLNLKDGLAIQGYDPVSYFMESGPKKGSKEIASVYESAKYFFVSKENKSKFETNPSRFVPEYGGWCAYAMGESGEKVKIDPETYKIIDGKLYLFYNFFFNNTLEDWNDNEKELKQKADSNWAKLIRN